MLRTCLLAAAAALLSATLPVAAQQSKSSSWSTEKMRLAPQPRPLPPGIANDELKGNCAGLTVTIKTRIEKLKTLQEKATAAQWPPPSLKERWASRPLGGDIAREREQVARLNRALGAKGCETLDVRAELKRAPAAKTK